MSSFESKLLLQLYFILKEIFNEYPDEEIIDEIYNAINSLNYSGENMKNMKTYMWIAVTDKMPPENTRVLVLRKESTYKICIAEYRYITGGGGYWIYEPNFISPNNPTHWQLLPEGD